MSKKERKKSQYQKKTDNLLIILGVAALIIIPYISFEFAYASDIYLLTFSQIAGRFGEQNRLIIWGISLLTFFGIVVMYVNTLLKNRSILLNILLGIMVFLYLVTVLVPFIPSFERVISDIHNYCAYLAVVVTVLYLFIFIGSFYKYDKALFWKAFISLLLVVLIMVFLYIKWGTSSIWQAVFSTAICVYLYFTMLFVIKSPYTDPEKTMRELIEEKRKKDKEREEHIKKTEKYYQARKEKKEKK